MAQGHLQAVPGAEKEEAEVSKSIHMVDWRVGGWTLKCGRRLRNPTIAFIEKTATCPECLKKRPARTAKRERQRKRKGGKG